MSKIDIKQLAHLIIKICMRSYEQYSTHEQLLKKYNQLSKCFFCPELRQFDELFHEYFTYVHK